MCCEYFFAPYSLQFLLCFLDEMRMVMCCLATRSNNKILHTLVALKRYFTAALVSPLPNSEQTNHPSSNHTYTKSTPNHIHHHYTPSVTDTIYSASPNKIPFVIPLFIDRPRWIHTELLARLTEKLAGGPQTGRLDSPPSPPPPISQGQGSGKTITTEI